MAVKLLFVLLLETEEDLDGARSLRNLSGFCDDDTRRVSGNWRCIKRRAQGRGGQGLLKNMRCHVFSRDRVLSDTLLVTTHLMEVNEF